MADDIGIQQEMLIEPTHKKLEIVDGHAVKDVRYRIGTRLYKDLSRASQKVPSFGGRLYDRKSISYCKRCA